MELSYNILLTFGINGSLRKREVQSLSPYTEHYLFNSTANLKAYSNNGLDFAYYGYNASNTRTYKLSMLNQNQWTNGQPEPIHLQLQSAMFYPNAYLTFNQNGNYTKHYYNGSERICSRLGDQTFSLSGNVAFSPQTQQRLGIRIMQVDQRARAELLEVVEAGDIPIETPSVDITSLQPANPNANSHSNSNTSNDIFYYHTNHLGSTAFVTDQNQNITQGFLYAPFGEITTEYAPLWQNGTLPKYAFNAKELDEETGMYYYEARYYKPPVFTSRDPMMDQKPWLSPYHYCSNNPVGRVDPTGCDNDWWEVDGKMVWFANSDDFKNSKYEGKGEYKGKTYQKNGVYYSLFGQQVKANSTNGKITKKIDEAFIQYAEYSIEIEHPDPNNAEWPEQYPTDLSGIISFQEKVRTKGPIKSLPTTGENIHGPDEMGQYAGIADIYFYVSKVNMKGKFLAWECKSIVTGNNGSLSTPQGKYLSLYRPNSTNNVILGMNFKTLQNITNFKNKFYTLFPDAKPKTNE